jgi:hypothetical protein
MPSIASRRTTGPKQHEEPPRAIQNPVRARPPLPIVTPGLNPILRCPMPILSTSPSDNLRQFYGPGIPQYRFLPPKAINRTS